MFLTYIYNKLECWPGNEGEEAAKCHFILFLPCCHDIQYNNTQHNDTHHNDTQHNDTQHKRKQKNTISIITFNKMVDCCYAESFMLSVMNDECHELTLYSE